MKKLFTFFMTLLLIFGCEEVQPAPEAMITFDSEQQTDISIPSDGETFDVCFTSALDWTAEIVYISGGEGWASMNLTSGKGGYSIARLKVNVQKNSESEPRSAKVVITSETKKATVSFTQEGHKGLLPGPDKDLVFRLTEKSAEVPAEGGTVKVTVEYNVDYECKVAVDWIREVESRSYDQKVHVFEVQPNDSEEPRNTTISFCGNGTCIPFMIEQTGCPPKPYLEIESESFSVSAEGTAEPLSLNVTSNVAWSVECASDWISIDPASGEGDGTVIINVGENDDTGSRSASVKVASADGNISRTLVILQEAAPKVFELSDGYADVGPEAGTINITVRYNVDYRCDVSVGWIREVTSKTVSEKVHTFEILPNESEEPRSGLISFISDGETIDFRVNQNGYAPEPYLNLSTHGLTIEDGSSVSLKVIVSSNVSWCVENNIDWLTVDPMSGNGDGYFMVNVAENDTAESREGSFTIGTTDGYQSYRFSVNQGTDVPLEPEEDVFKLSAQSVEVEAEGGKAEVTVTSNVEYKYELTVDWIKEVTTKAADEYVHTFEVMPNETSEERRTVISFCGNDNCLPFTIIQKGKQIDEWLEVDMKSISVEFTGTDTPIKVNVTSNVRWRVESDADWCVVTPTSGENDGTFEVSISESTSSSPRMANITVSSSNEVVSREISVIQAPVSSETDDDSWVKEEFVHRSLVMRFTADWCGYCPIMATAVHMAQESLPDKIEALSVHGGGSGLASKASEALTRHYGIEAFPTGLIDGMTQIQNNEPSVTAERIINAVNETEAKYETLTGASWTSSVDGSQIVLNLSLYMKKSGSYKVTALLVEDGIIGYQADYTNGSSENYEHNGVIRSAFTEAAGDEFTQLEDGQKKDFNYSMSIPYGCNEDNLKIVVYVQKHDGSTYYIDNAASAAVGETKMLAVKSGNWGSGNEGITPGDDIIL